MEAEAGLEWLVEQNRHSMSSMNGAKGKANHSINDLNLVLTLLERLQHQQSKPVSNELQQNFLDQVIESKNVKLLERASSNASFLEDATGRRLLIMGWCQLGSRQATQRAAHILLLPKVLSSSPLSFPSSTTSSNHHNGDTTTTPTCMLKSYRLVLTLLAKHGDAKRSLKVLQHMLQQQQKEDDSLTSPDRDCFHRVLSASVQANDVEVAQECLVLMKEYATTTTGGNCCPTTSTYRMLLSIWAKSKQPALGSGKRAYELLQEMEESNEHDECQPDLTCYNITMNALAQEGNYLLAQTLWMKLLENNTNQDNNAIQPDQITFYTLLKAFAQSNTRTAAERAERLLRTISDHQTSSITLDARAYATVIAIWAKLGEADRALALLQELLDLYQEQGNNWKPDQICFQTAIGCLSKANDRPARDQHRAQQALDLLRQMRQLGHTTNLLTCNTVLHCIAKGSQPQQAEQVLQDMRHEWGVAPDIVSYNTVMFAYAHLGNTDRASQLFQQLLDSRQNHGNLPAPNTRTFAAMLTALSKDKTIQSAERAEQLFLHMQELYESGQCLTRPNIITYNAVLNCWAAQKAGPRAESILREMQKLPAVEQPNVVSYNTVIHAYWNDVAKGEALVQEMLKRRITPDESTRNSLLKVLAHDESIANKEERAQQLRERYFTKLPLRTKMPPRDGRRNLNNLNNNRKKKSREHQHQATSSR
jgi:pentatricopeptide repeat protein